MRDCVIGACAGWLGANLRVALWTLRALSVELASDGWALALRGGLGGGRREPGVACVRVCGVGVVGWRGRVVVELIASEEGAQVDAADEFVVDELAWGAFGELLAGVDDVRAVADAEGLLDVVVGDEAGDAALGEGADFLLDILDGDRVNAGEGFVEKDELGFGDEGAGDLELSAFAA